ncbi:MAG: LssY C-terminal domain-containing protein [Bryobacteraceae bacterium]
MILRVALLAIAAAVGVVACEKPDPPLLHVRLLTPLASDSSKRGSQFSTVVTAPLLYCGEALIPSGSLVSGTVRRANRVGLGLIHERAALELNFKTYELPDGRTYPLGAQLADVDNSREKVTPRGQIKGILAASNANRFFRGVWFKPTADLAPRSLVGLTGASNQVWEEFDLGPQGAAALFVLQLFLFRFPEPEINLPIGTDMKIRISSLPENVPSYAAPPVSEVPGLLAEWLGSRPFDVTNPDDTSAEDIVNFAFLGTQDQLLQAFDSAGWDLADDRTPRTFSLSYNAYATRAGYATAPVSKLFYQGATPNFVFQKSFNTIEKRHHIRVWSIGSFEGNDIWLGAATHDIGVSLLKASKVVTHKIDPHIDLERDKVVEDLTFEDCVEPPGYVDRSSAVSSLRDNSSISTDGRLAVLTLRDCDPVSDDPDPLKRPGRKVDKLVRRMLLEGRQHLLRDNIYYYGFEGIKKLVQRPSRPAPQTAFALTAAGKTLKHPAAQSNTNFSWTAPVTNAFSSPTNTFSSDLTPNSGR